MFHILQSSFNIWNTSHALKIEAPFQSLAVDEISPARTRTFAQPGGQSSAVMCLVKSPKRQARPFCKPASEAQEGGEL